LLDLELETIRHITNGNFTELRAANVTPDLFSLDTQVPTEQDKLLKVKALLGFAEQHGSKGSLMLDEFPWLEANEDDYLVEPETEIPYLANKLRKRLASHIQRRYVWELANASPEDFVDLYVQGSRRVYQTMAEGSTIVDGSNAISVVENQKRRIEEKKTLGESLGFPVINEWTGGIRPGHLAILAALPKRMKTWFEVEAFVDQIRSGKNPILFTFELDVDEMTGRVLCRMAGDVSYTRYYRGQLLPQEWKRVERAVEEFQDLGGKIVDINHGNRYVSSLLLEADRHQATCVIVDQFSYLQSVQFYGQEHQGYKEIIYDIKSACKAWDLPWYMAAQLNRQSVAEDDFPIAQHLGLTRAVEEVSDLIMGIKLNDALKEEHKIMLGVIEGRHCESGPNARWTIEHDLYNATKFELQEV
jgi:replicative DNA helicase